MDQRERKDRLRGGVWTPWRSWTAAAAIFVFVLLQGAGSSGRADAAEFEVRPGYLSASVRDIVEGYGWSLVWAADEDRVVDYAFVIGNGSLREALTDLLAIYRGQFVADLYAGNRVVLVDAAPPRIRVVLPDAASRNDQSSVVVPSDAASSVVAASPAASDADVSPPAKAPSEPGGLPVKAVARDKDLAERDVLWASD